MKKILLVLICFSTNTAFANKKSNTTPIQMVQVQSSVPLIFGVDFPCQDNTDFGTIADNQKETDAVEHSNQ